MLINQAFSGLLWYTYVMKKTDLTPIFTDEQLNSMSKENLALIVASMQKKVEALQQTMADKENQVKLLEEKNSELEFLNALLSEKLSVAQRKQFGASSEKYKDGYEQLSLFNEAEANADLNEAEPEMEEICPSAYTRKKKTSEKDFDISKLPVSKRIEHKLHGKDLICECGGKMKVVTTESKRTLEFVPAHFEIIEEVTYVYSCNHCSKMKRPEKDPGLFNSGIATPSLVSAIINGKYVNGLPLERQHKEFKRFGLELSTKTMSNWMIKVSDRYLSKLFNMMKEELLKSQYLHCDETRVQVLDEPAQSPNSKNWMWVYMTGINSGHHRMVLFDYERTRGGYHPKEFLEGVGECFITCDGYEPYHNLPENITITGCFAHVRRRFEKCLEAHKKNFTKEELKNTNAYKGMQFIGKLYDIEAEIKEKSAEEKYVVRQNESKPVLEAFFEWIHSIVDQTDSKSLIGDAIHYSFNQEKYLRRYLEDGHLEIDNNNCERQIKNFAIGRRNWLFCKSINGANASAIIYSITETALLNKLNPYRYLTYVLDSMRKLPEFGAEDQIKDLLPWSEKLPKNLTVKEVNTK